MDHHYVWWLPRSVNSCAFRQSTPSFQMCAMLWSLWWSAPSLLVYELFQTLFELLHVGAVTRTWQLLPLCVAVAKNDSLWAVDHSARVSRKSKANFVISCELQDALIIYLSNAYCGYGIPVAPFVRGSVVHLSSRSKVMACEVSWFSFHLSKTVRGASLRWMYWSHSEYIESVRVPGLRLCAGVAVLVAAW